MSGAELARTMLENGALDAYVSSAWLSCRVPNSVLSGTLAPDVPSVVRTIVTEQMPHLARAAKFRAAEDSWEIDGALEIFAPKAPEHTDAWMVRGCAQRRRGNIPDADGADRSGKATHLCMTPHIIVFSVCADADSVPPDTVHAVAYLEDHVFALQDIGTACAKALEKHVMCAAGMRPNLMGDFPATPVLRRTLRPMVRRTDRGRTVCLDGKLVVW